MNFANHLLTLRIERGFTKSEVAKAIGVTRHAVSFWENGRTHNLKHASLLKLAKLYRVTLEELLAASKPKQQKAVLSEAEQIAASLSEEQLTAWLEIGRLMNRRHT